MRASYDTTTHSILKDEDDPDVWDETVSMDQIIFCAEIAAARFPCYSDAQITSSWSGLYVTPPLPIHFFFFNWRTLIRCTNPVGAPYQCPSQVGSKLPLPLYADVRLHILVTRCYNRYDVSPDFNPVLGQWPSVKGADHNSCICVFACLHIFFSFIYVYIPPEVYIHIKTVLCGT